MMQNRCNSYHVIGGSCSCGWYYNDNNNNPNNSFSMMFSPVQNHYNNDNITDHEESDMYHYQYQYASSPSSSVDCTLSLGTPSTRSNHDNHHHAVISEKKTKPKFFSWNFLQPSSNSKSHESSSTSNKSSNRTASNNYSNSYSGGNGDSGAAQRRCANCDTTSTPLWRNGPKGPKSLCNACGIRYKKEEKRAAAAAANNSDGGNAAGAVDAHHVLNSTPWVHNSQNQMMPCISSVYSNEFSFIEDIDDSGNPFLFRRLNVH